MNTCRTCRFWSIGPGDRFGECLSEKLVGFEDECPSDGAKVLERDNGAYCLRTGPDFGCVHHSAAETAVKEYPQVSFEPQIPIGVEEPQ